jgi:Bacterial mobilisation protein (MobC)
MSEGLKPETKRSSPRRGRLPIADPKTIAISFRCTAKDHAAIHEKAAKAGLSVGAFLRNLALGSPGPRAVRRPPIERKELARLLGHLGKIGGNINQIAKAFNSGGQTPGFAEMVAVLREVGEMRAALMKALGRGD